MKLLWYEYRDTAKREGLKAYSYQAFCCMFAVRAAQSDVTAHLEHMPSDKVFIDRSGNCPHLTDPLTGWRMRAQVFIAVFPRSGLIFTQATPDRRMASWLEANRDMLEWFEGVPSMLASDQCATAVDRTPRGSMETRVNRQYLEFAEHCGIAVVPARGFKPRDKALVEEAVDPVSGGSSNPRDRCLSSSRGGRVRRLIWTLSAFGLDGAGGCWFPFVCWLFHERVCVSVGFAVGPDDASVAGRCGR